MAKIDPRIIKAANTASEEVMNRSIRHGAFLQGYENSQVRELVKFLNKDVQTDLLSQLNKYAGSGKVTETRIKNLLAANQQVLTQAYKQMGTRFTKEMKQFVASEAKWQSAVIEDALPINIDIQIPHIKQLKNIVNNTFVEGRLVSEWFKDLGTNTHKNVTRELRVGLANGEGITNLTRRLKGTRAAGYADGVLNKSRHEIRTIVRTATNDMANKASEAVYAQNEDIIKGVKIVATLDTRTSDICMSEDGNVYGIHEGPRPPFHHQCRTRTTAVLKSWKEMGLKLKDLPPGTRASMDGQVPGNWNYQQWLTRQPKGVQIKALGKGKASLFRSGKLKTKDLVNSFGKPISLEQLRTMDFKSQHSSLKMLRGESKASLDTKVNGLLGNLKNATGDKAKKSIRAKLRRLGHEGGLDD